MNAYCDRQSVDPSSIAFLFDGRRLRAEQTPAEVFLVFVFSSCGFVLVILVLLFFFSLLRTRGMHLLLGSKFMVSSSVTFGVVLAESWATCLMVSEGLLESCGTGFFCM